jgi:hypothetical protein
MKPTVPEVLPLVDAVYARHCAGCCFHVVLDDWNIEKHFIDSACDWAMERGHEDCMALAEKMRHMTPTQVRKLAARKTIRL